MIDYTLLSFHGRLTDDPELFTSDSGVNICKFTVACNKRIGKGKERTTYIPTAVFGHQAEICHEYLSKGREVQVVGEFETDKYEDKEGNVRKGFTCVVRDVPVKFGAGGSKQNTEIEAPELAKPKPPVRNSTSSRKNIADYKARMRR